MEGSYGDENESVSVSNASKDPDVSSPHLYKTSRWVELPCKGEVCTADLVKSIHGNEFACLHNRDGTDFMNEAKFERFILKCTNDNVSFSWDLLDETSCSSRVVVQIVEDEDQGPSKEWGQ
jgi:hypothetical protein